MENVVVAVFPVESEAYQAFSRIKDGTTELSGYLVSQMAIVKKMGNNAIKALVDSGYLSDSRTKKIQPVYLMPEVKDWLVRLGREDLIDVMECTI